MSSEKRTIFTKCTEFQYAQQAKASGYYPYFRAIEGLSDNRVVYNGKPMIMIGSNNYLGLAHDPRVIEASQQAISQFGVGCTGSRFLNGNSVIHDQLEAELAELLQKEAVLLHSTGFFANLGTLNTLCTEGDWILCDRENHASIIEGCQSSGAKTLPFAHNCMRTLRRRLQRVPENDGKLIIMDGVYSMSGDIAKLPEIVAIAKETGAQTYVDEAHSLGVLGPKGEGTVAHFGLQNEVDLIMGTFSKSLGSMGGFIAGPRDVIDFLKHTTRCMIFTASLAPAIVGAVRKSLEIMLAEPERKEMLWKNTRKMHEGFKSLGFNIGTTQTPIVPILIGSETKAFLFAHKLLEAGIFVTPAVYPAVKYGQAIVRTSYMATHTDDELDFVLETFARLGKELGIFDDAAYIGDTNNRGKPYSGYDFSLYQQEPAKTVRAGS